MQDNKTFYLFVKGQKVEVSEEIYRAYVQPERKQRMREYRAKNKIVVSSIEGLEEKGFEVADESQDFLTSLIDLEEENERKTLLAKALSCLKEQDKQIVQLYFYDNKTQDEIADILGVSRQYISKKIKQILEKLKQFF